MESIKISVAGNLTSAVIPGALVAGTVGLPVEFTFDPTWSELQKTAVFRAGGKTVDVLCGEDAADVPWEVLKKPGCHLWAGVYGTNADGTVQTPTVWTDLGVIQPGTDPSGDESADPTLPVWQQLSNEVEEALKAVIKLENKMISGEIRPVEG